MSSNHEAYRLGGRVTVLKLMAFLAVLGIAATVALHLLFG
jgi:hypothetical protein